MGRYPDTGWLFVSRDHIRLTHWVDGSDEAHIERLVLDHPYLDIYPPMTEHEWKHFLHTEHPLDRRANQ
jgi:hypothetical protein